MRWVLIGLTVLWVSTMVSLMIGACIKAGNRPGPTEEYWGPTWDDIQRLEE